MGLSGIRLILPALVIGYFCPVFGQTSFPNPAASSANDPDPKLYESFFQQVVRLKSFSNPYLGGEANGKPVVVIVPEIQKVIGLTDAEVALLNTAAADCLSKLQAFRTPVGLIFEARLQFIESGKVSKPVAQELDDLERQHNQTVLDRVQQLHTAFGDSRFQVLDDYVHSSKSQRELMPVINFPGALPSRTVQKN